MSERGCFAGQSSLVEWIVGELVHHDRVQGSGSGGRAEDHRGLSLDDGSQCDEGLRELEASLDMDCSQCQHESDRRVQRQVRKDVVVGRKLVSILRSQRLDGGIDGGC